jgi:hypothetical protein
VTEINRSSSRPSRPEKKAVRVAQITDRNQIPGRADSDGEYGLASAVTQTETKNDAAQGPAIPAEMRPDAPCPVLTLRPSLLSDPAWVRDFARIVNDLLDAASDLRWNNLPSYRVSVIDRRWRPSLDRLAAHLTAAQEAHDVPRRAPCAINPDVEEAFHLATAVLRDASDPTGPTGSIDVALLGIAMLLPQAQANPHATPPVPPADPPPPVAAGRPPATDRRDAGPAALERNDPASAELVDQIRRQRPRRKLQAALVEFMQDRQSATYLDVEHRVYGGEKTEGGAIEQLARRTNDTLLELSASFFFRCGGEHVFKCTTPS